jgi:RNA polymerase sigma-70 factor (ECF subfamily)
VNGPALAIPALAQRESQNVVTAEAQREFAALVEEHQSMVFSIALHYLRNRESAEEVAQEVFLQLYRHRERLTGAAHVAAWLRRVACHRSIDEARRRRLDPRTSLTEYPEPASAAVPGDAAEGDPMLRERLRRLVQSLPEKARAVMILRYQEDLDPEEIARTLEMPVRTVKSHLQRSLALLREKLGRARGELV